MVSPDFISRTPLHENNAYIEGVFSLPLPPPPATIPPSEPPRMSY